MNENSVEGKYFDPFRFRNQRSATLPPDSSCYLLCSVCSIFRDLCVTHYNVLNKFLKSFSAPHFLSFFIQALTDSSFLIISDSFIFSLSIFCIASWYKINVRTPSSLSEHQPYSRSQSWQEGRQTKDRICLCLHDLCCML